MLYVYADESELQESKTYTVAAYTFSDVGLPIFEPEWQAELDREGLSWFHMTDFENYREDYEGWSRERHDRLIIRLIDIIRRTVVAGSACSVDVQGMEELTGDQRRFAGSPYINCLTRLMGNVAAQLRFLMPSSETTAWIFDDDAKGTAKKNIGILHQVFEWARADGDRRDRYRIDSETRAAARSVLPIQAADILAYEAAKEAARGLGHSQRPIRKSAEVLFDMGLIRTILTTVDKDGIVHGLNAWASEVLHQMGQDAPPGSWKA